MKKIFCAILGIMLFASCKRLQLENINGGDDLMSAVTYVASLKNQEKLPKIHKDDHGKLTSIPIDNTKAFIRENGVLEVVICMTINTKKDLIFYYKINRKDKTSQWNLTDAWQTDKWGKNRISILD